MLEVTVSSLRESVSWNLKKEKERLRWESKTVSTLREYVVKPADFQTLPLNSTKIPFQTWFYVGSDDFYTLQSLMCTTFLVLVTMLEVELSNFLHCDTPKG